MPAVDTVETDHRLDVLIEDLDTVVTDPDRQEPPAECGPRQIGVAPDQEHPGLIRGPGLVSHRIEADTRQLQAHGQILSEQLHQWSSLAPMLVVSSFGNASTPTRSWTGSCTTRSGSRPAATTCAPTPHNATPDDRERSSGSQARVLLALFRNTGGPEWQYPVAPTHANTQPLIMCSPKPHNHPAARDPPAQLHITRN